MTLREHGSKSDPNYDQYHPNSGTRQQEFSRSGWNASVGPVVERALHQYTGAMYAAINAHLRGKPPPEPWPKEDLVEWSSTIQSGMRPAEEPLDLYRGTSYSAFESVLGEALRVDTGNGTWMRGERSPKSVIEALESHVGEVFSDAGFMSTSLVDDIDRYKSRELTMLISAPEGTMSLHASEESAFGDQEHEVILDAGTKWRLDGVRKGRNGVVVHVTVMP